MKIVVVTFGEEMSTFESGNQKPRKHDPEPNSKTVSLLPEGDSTSSSRERQQ
jgi:hypothetical protein